MIFDFFFLFWDFDFLGGDVFFFSPLMLCANSGLAQPRSGRSSFAFVLLLPTLWGTRARRGCHRSPLHLVDLWEALERTKEQRKKKKRGQGS